MATRFDNCSSKANCDSHVLEAKDLENPGLSRMSTDITNMILSNLSPDPLALALVGSSCTRLASHSEHYWRYVCRAECPWLEELHSENSAENSERASCRVLYSRRTRMLSNPEACPLSAPTGDELMLREGDGAQLEKDFLFAFEASPFDLQGPCGWSALVECTSPSNRPQKTRDDDQLANLRWDFENDFLFSEATEFPLLNDKFEKTGHSLASCGPSCLAEASGNFVAFLIRKSDHKMLKLGEAEMCNPTDEDDADGDTFIFQLHEKLQVVITIDIGYCRQPGYCPKYCDNPYTFPPPEWHTTLTHLDMSMGFTDDYGLGEPTAAVVQSANELFTFLAGAGSELFS